MFDEDDHRWVHVENDRLRPNASMTGNDRSRAQKFYHQNPIIGFEIFQHSHSFEKIEEGRWRENDEQFEMD